MTYPPVEGSVRPEARGPVVPSASPEKAFREEVESSRPPVSLGNHEKSQNSSIDELFKWNGSSLNFSPTLRVVDQDGTIKSRDDAGNLKTVEFYKQPGKVHNYGYNEKNELISVDRKDKSTGEDLSLKRESDSNSWYLEKNGSHYFLPGKVDLRQNGDFAVEQKDGTWRVEDVSGNIIDERRLASGASVQLNDDKTVSKITRADGTQIACKYGENGELTGITETRGGQTSSWSRNQSGEFRQAGNEDVRKELSVDQNGNIKFKSLDSSNHVITGDGSHVVSGGDSKTTSTYDNEGRLSDYKKADGSSRHFDYEGKTNKVSNFTELNTKGEVVKTYERTGDSEWKCMEGKKSLGIWPGDIKTGLDGSWRMFEEKAQNPDSLWRNVDNQENTTYFRDNKDGSRITFDGNKKFSEIERADGTGVVWSTNGDAPRVSTLMPDGSKLQFDFDMKSRTWKCDSPNIKESAEMPIQGNGQLTFKTTDGNTTTIKTDSSTTITKPDGTVLKFDAANNLTSQSRAGKERVFEREGNQITGYTEHLKDKPDRHVDLINDRNIKLTANGDLFHTAADGKPQIETSDFSHVDCNEAGKPVKVTAANGAIREIEWNPATQQPVSVTDRIKIGEGEVSRKWETGGPDWKGTFAVIGEKDGKLTQRFARHDVQFDEVGNYRYLTAGGEKILSKAGDGVRTAENGWVSASIDEAHSNFLDNMRQTMKDEPRSERLESMMTGFETRMSNTIERRVAGGEAEDKVRAEVEQKVTATYDHLSRLVSSDNPACLDNKATRTMLAETFMYHAWEPETVTQEGWGSCWLQSGYVPCGLGEHPDDMAKVITDVSLTGSFTDRTNQSYKFDQSQLGINNSSQGAGWSIAKAMTTSEPSPVAHRLDETLSVMDRGANYRGAGDEDRIRRGGGGEAEILARVTGDKLLVVNGYPQNSQQRAALVHSGGAQRDGGRNHVATWALRKDGEHWLLVRGNQYNDDNRGDRIVAVIRDLKSWIQNGEAASINKRFGPSFGKDFKVVADEVKPTDYKPNNRPNDRFNDPDNERPLLRFFARRRRRS